MDCQFCNFVLVIKSILASSDNPSTAYRHRRHRHNCRHCPCRLCQRYYCSLSVTVMTSLIMRRATKMLRVLRLVRITGDQILKTKCKNVRLRGTFFSICYFFSSVQMQTSIHFGAGVRLSVSCRPAHKCVCMWARSYIYTPLLGFALFYFFIFTEKWTSALEKVQKFQQRKDTSSSPFAFFFFSQKGSGNITWQAYEAVNIYCDQESFSYHNVAVKWRTKYKTK